VGGRGRDAFRGAAAAGSRRRGGMMMEEEGGGWCPALKRGSSSGLLCVFVCL
jgi:hypothetical protein